MYINICIYAKHPTGTICSRSIQLNQGELDEMITDYIKDQYLKPHEILDSFEFEGFGDL